MNIPSYWFSIPKYKFHNGKIRKIKSFPHYLITPVNLSIMRIGSMEMKNGQVFQNVELKTVTILDIYKKMKPFLIIGVLILICATFVRFL